MEEPKDPKPSGSFERELRLSKLELEQFKTAIQNLTTTMETIADTLPSLPDEDALKDLEVQLGDANIFAKSMARAAERTKSAIQTCTPSDTSLTELEAHKAMIEEYREWYEKTGALIDALGGAVQAYEEAKNTNDSGS